MMVTSIRRLVARMNRPAVHWSVSAPLSGLRVLDGALGQASPASWPAPAVLGDHGNALRLAAPVGINARQLVIFTGARAIDQNGVIELADGALLAEPAWHPDIVEPWLRHRRHRMRSRRQRGAWFSCLLEFSYNYYHWICEVLPRLYKVLDRLPADVRFVVPATMAEWQWDSLAALGVPRSRCAQLPRDEAWTFDELYYAGPVATCGDHDPRAIEWLRSVMMRSVGGVDSSASRRLYLTRRLTRRSIANEAEHWRLFADAGFTMVEAERMTFADQVRVFGAASVVVAPNGAGSANIMWCAPPATVVEIFSPAFATQRCGWTLASAAGHRYAAAMAADAGTPALDLQWSEPLVRQILEWALDADPRG